MTKGFVFIFEEPRSKNERLRSLARSQALSHTSTRYHRRRREREVIEASLLPPSTRSVFLSKPACRRREHQNWTNHTHSPSPSPSHALPSPNKLFSTWTIPEFKYYYDDVDFYAHEVAPQFHLTYKIFDVFDIYEQYFLRPIPKLARITWQCNMSSYRTRTATTEIFHDQYYQRYGEVLSAYREKLRVMDHQKCIDSEVLETTLMLINVSFMSESPGSGDIHLRRLLDLLRENRHNLPQQDALFLQCLLRQYVP